MRTRVLKASASAIRAAAAIIRAGGLVAFPTETVYGLGANAFDPVAVRKVFAAKRRPADNPLIVHIASARELDRLVLRVPPAARTLARRFWPGPLTLVLPRRPEIPAEVSCGLPSIAVRLPRHPVARALIRAAGVPIAAPSANLAGRPSPTTARHVVHDLAGRIDCVIDGGAADIGLESTVVDCTGPRPRVLRPGGVTLEQLQRVVPRIVVGRHTSAKPVSPGMKYRHYAPKVPVVLGSPARLALLARKELAAGRNVAVLAAADRYPSGAVVRIIGRSSEKWASRLFAELRSLERSGADIILAEKITASGVGRAVMNRLRKAASEVLA